MKILVLFLSLSQISDSIDQLSQNYKIPSYFGSRFQDFLFEGNVIKGQLTSFYWFNRVYQYGTDFYYTDPEKHVIWKINEESTGILYKILDGYRQLVAGTLNLPGYRDGDFSNSQFNTPSGIAYTYLSKLDIAREQSKKTIILKNNTIEFYFECLYCNQYNYTTCNDTNFTVETNANFNYQIYQSVDPYKIKDIYFLDEQTESQLQNQFEDPVIYIADQKNHCIRKLDLKSMITQTIAGQCGQSGFKDGQIGVSLLNNPTSIGVDPLGTVFFYDSGNLYIRIINTQGVVYTLLGGACREDVRFSPLKYQSMKIRRVLCYRDWIKTSGEPSGHILTSADNMTVCTEHYTDCPDEI